MLKRLGQLYPWHGRSDRIRLRCGPRVRERYRTPLGTRSGELGRVSLNAADLALDESFRHPGHLTGHCILDDLVGC